MSASLTTSSLVIRICLAISVKFHPIIDPGSVGQPRDKNPAAAYAVWANGQIHFKRADYDIAEVERSFASSGLRHHDIRMLMAVLRSGG